jgi:hypothetical protein
MVFDPRNVGKLAPSPGRAKILRVHVAGRPAARHRRHRPRHRSVGRRRIAHDKAPTQRQQVGVCVLCPIFAGLPWARASEL